jgi:NAD-dependent DNA ligase
MEPKRIAELENLIRGYQDSYYNGEAEISDAEFDALWDELKRLDPESTVITRIGADKSDGFPKARHLIPMGSQEKAANPGEFRAWAEKLKLPLYIAQYKLDGASLELQYGGGRLERALTRGDGVKGDDISANARKMKGVVNDLGVDWSGGIRCEVLSSMKSGGISTRTRQTAGTRQTASCGGRTDRAAKTLHSSPTMPRRTGTMAISRRKPKKSHGSRRAALT